VVELVLCAICLWAAWYRTPAGALVRSVGAIAASQTTCSESCIEPCTIRDTANAPARATINVATGRTIRSGERVRRSRSRAIFHSAAGSRSP